MVKETHKPKPVIYTAELAFVGAIIVDHVKVLKIADIYGISASYFSNEVARIVYGASIRRKEQKKPIDAISIQQESGLDVSVIQGLVDNSPPVAHSEYYARLIRDTYLKNQVLSDLKNTEDATGLRMLLENWLYRVTDISMPAQSISVDSWLTEPDEQERPIIDGYFDMGDRVAIVGQSKARKSFYTLQLAISITTGCEFFGVRPHPQKVLLVNGEVAARSYKKRLRRMLEKMNAPLGLLNNLHIANTSDIDQEISFNSILTLAKKNNATVCIIDPAYLLLGDEIDQKQVKEAVQDMKRFAASGITLISVFHATKGKIGDKQAIDRISGSGIFARDAATLISLCEHANEPDHIVVNAITRNYPPKDPVTLCFKDGAFIFTNIDPIEKTSSTANKRTVPLNEAIKCFPVESIAYGEAINRLKDKLGIGRNKAVELISEMTIKEMLVTTPFGKKTMYSVNRNKAV